MYGRGGSVGPEARPGCWVRCIWVGSERELLPALRTPKWLSLSLSMACLLL